MTHSDGRAEGIMTKNARRLVVFVSDFPFSPRDEVRFGLSFFVSRGYTPIIVNVADLSANGCRLAGWCSKLFKSEYA